MSPRSRRIRNPNERAKRRWTRNGKTEGERKRDREDRVRKGDREREDVRAQALATCWTRGRHIDPRFHNLHPLLRPATPGLLPLLPPRSPSPPPTSRPRPARSPPSSSHPVLYLRKPHALCPSIRRRLHLPPPYPTSVSFP